MHLSSKTRLATGILLAALLAGCGASGDSSSGSGSSSGGSSSGGSSSGGSSSGGSSSGGSSSGGSTNSALILDPVQSQLSGVLVSLGNAVQANTPAGTPLDIGGFLLALDPTVNQLLTGPSSTLTGLLNGVRTIIADPSPTGFQAAAGDIQTGIEALPPAVSSLAQNLPCALATLLGQRASVCTGTDPAVQLQNLVALFGSGNPFAGTPLAPLGTIGAPGTPSGGPTGTPLDQILTPLRSILGVPAVGSTPAIPALPLDSSSVAALGDGLATVGDAIVDGYNNVPGSTSIPLAGDLVLTLGNTLTDLATTLAGLTPTSGSTTGTAVAKSLLDISNVLTAPSGLLGTLALISGNSGTLTSVGTGNTQLDNGISQLTSVLESSIAQPSGSSLTSSLTSLGDLTCALSILGTCSGTGSSAASNLTALGSTLTTLLTTSLGSTPGSSLITTLTGTLSTDSVSNNTLLTDLTGSIQTITDPLSSGGSTGLLGGSTSGGGLLGGLLGGSTSGGGLLGGLLGGLIGLL